ncbi:MAG: hypothetical protein AABW79_01435 [Nanoarchaeota archaeon]
MSWGDTIRGRSGLLFSVVVLSVFVLSFFTFGFFASALHLITNSATGNNLTLSILENNQSNTNYFIFNITVNNTDPTIAANISGVNITIPSSFNLVSFSNTTVAGNATAFVIQHSFVNTTDSTAGTITLSWLNSSGLVFNFSGFQVVPTRFTFNASATTPGSYNITVTTLNVTGSYSRNLSVNVNDTTTPAGVEYDSLTHVAGANISRSNITVNISVTDNGNVDRIAVYLYNSTGLLNTTYSDVGARSYYVAFVNLGQGIYSYNASANDTFSFANQTNANRTVVVDTAAPSGTLSCTPESVDRNDAVTCSCSSSDVTSGVNSTSFTASPSTVNTGTFTSSCTIVDYAGNVGIVTDTYTVSGSGSNAASSSGGGSGSAAVSWTKTVPQASIELSQTTPVAQNLGSRERVALKVGGQTHHVGVVSLTTSSVIVEVSSDPQRGTLSVGEEKMFDVDGDGYYDLVVKLISIVSGKANVEINAVHVMVEESATSDDTEESQGVAGAISSVASNSMTWIWVALVVVVVVVIAVVMMRRKR